MSSSLSNVIHNKTTIKGAKGSESTVLWDRDGPLLVRACSRRPRGPGGWGLLRPSPCKSLSRRSGQTAHRPSLYRSKRGDKVTTITNKHKKDDEESIAIHTHTWPIKSAVSNITRHTMQGFSFHYWKRAVHLLTINVSYYLKMFSPSTRMKTQSLRSGVSGHEALDVSSLLVRLSLSPMHKYFFLPLSLASFPSLSPLPSIPSRHSVCCVCRREVCRLRGQRQRAKKDWGKAVGVLYHLSSIRQGNLLLKKKRTEMHFLSFSFPLFLFSFSPILSFLSFYSIVRSFVLSFFLSSLSTKWPNSVQR